MCYRYSNTQKLVNEIIEERLTEETRDKAYFYHASGFDNVPRPVITQQVPDTVQFYNWGLVPHWVKSEAQAKEAKLNNLNARSETIFEKPSFKMYVPNRRCIIPATGFYEWRHLGKEKYPYHVQVINETSREPQAFFFAGIYSMWNNEYSFSVITSDANDLMSYIHNSKNRMPVILNKNEALKWIEPDLHKDDISLLMRPYHTEYMTAHTIHKDITSRKVNPDREETLAPFDFQIEGVVAVV